MDVDDPDEEVKILVDGEVISASRVDIEERFGGLPSGCLKVLDVLSSGPMTVNQISDSVDLSVPMVRDYLDRLVDRDYVIVVGKVSRRYLYGATEKSLGVIGDASE